MNPFAAIKRLVFIAALKSVSLLPLTAHRALGVTLGVTLWYTSSRMAKVSVENIGLCFPALSSRQQRRLARASIIETGKTIVETAFAWCAPPTRCLDTITAVEGTEVLDRTGHRGHVFVIPHLGNWEIINHFLGRNYPLTHMYQPNERAWLDWTIQTQRARTGTRFVAVSAGGIRRQLETLRGGGNVGTMPDQEPSPYSGVFVTFFGHAALTNTLAAGLIQQTGAKPVVAAAVRAGNGFKVILRPIEDHARSVSRACATERINAAIENAVREYPEQYLWSYKRFRTRPEGERELYHLETAALPATIQHLLLRLGCAASRLAPLSSLQRAGALAGRLALASRHRLAKHTRVNLDLCLASEPSTFRAGIELASLCESAKSLAEAGKVWLIPDPQFDSLCLDAKDFGGLRSRRGALVLTPPLGNREVLMRYLGQRFRVTEYYHPAKSTVVDRLIKRRRHAMGVALLPHTDDSVRTLIERLEDGQVVTLCPDQQPRLAGGVFIPFFGVPALTTKALPRLLTESEADLFLAFAERSPSADGFRLRCIPLDLDGQSGVEECLNRINRALETVVRQHIHQYRWSDKRFNIRPQGLPKIYG